VTAQPTVRSRLQASGIGDERIALHHAAGRLRLDGEPVTDLDQPAPPPTRVVIAGE
jgi:hypothetical protein